MSLGCKGESESESGSDGIDVVFSWVAGFAGLLPVVSGVWVDNSLIINGVSFSGNGASLLVIVGFISSSGLSGWCCRNAFLSPCNRVSRFSGSLPVVSGVSVFKSLIINGISFSSNCGLPANIAEVAWG